ncbi:hypothetical protein E4665_07765 [Sporolactobacillus shoreae]|uniref:Uncharacterized protein n=1 Tax=Sporolactobacillus shoreae TaxID=1465501 RepID=A0A4Z0GNT6_9BACL|nr:hypothetical protein E4665_07765 [Sporolactobacillus shoreae]
MQTKNSDILSDEIIDKLSNYFSNKIDDFMVSDTTDTPYTMFKIEFVMYKFFNIVLNYDRGRFGCSIINGSRFITLDNSQKWYDKADMDIFLKELEEQLKLRIPDKFLEHYGWK